MIRNEWLFSEKKEEKEIMKDYFLAYLQEVVILHIPRVMIILGKSRRLRGFFFALLAFLMPPACPLGQ